MTSMVNNSMKHSNSEAKYKFFSQNLPAVPEH